MDGSTNFVVNQVSHLNSFINDSLSSESSITVDENRYYLGSLSVTYKILFSSSSTKNNWINTLQVGWVCEDSCGELLSVWVLLGE
jgi:hypothetical protein